MDAGESGGASAADDASPSADETRKQIPTFHFLAPSARSARQLSLGARAFVVARRRCQSIRVESSRADQTTAARDGKCKKKFHIRLLCCSGRERKTTMRAGIVVELN